MKSLALKAFVFVLEAFSLVMADGAVAARAGAAPPGPILGKIDGVARDGQQTFLLGWACQQGQRKSISIHIFADQSGNGAPAGTFVEAGIANFDSGPDVSLACRDREGSRHHFVVELPPALAANGRNSKLIVRGIRVVDGVENAAIAGSGVPLASLPAVAMQYPMLATFRPLAGAYRSLAQHPRVFATTAELQELAARINRAGSYSMQRFHGLAAQVQQDLAAPIAWDAAYSGCNIGVYLYAFSYEPQDGNAAEMVRSALHIDANIRPPAGAAVVASRLALYAALAKAGAHPTAGAPSAEQAAALARRILLAWSGRGLHDAQGRLLLYTQFCDGNGKPSNPALHLSRGIVYSVQAQDLLMYFGALGNDDTRQLDAFHSALFDMIRRAANNGFGTERPACEYYTNGGANVLAALLASARLLDDERKFDAVVRGDDRGIPVWLPWTVFFDYAIYGRSETPLDCYANTGPDSMTSHPGYTAPQVAAGEVQDRYRNNGPLQGIGYPMFTLQRLIDSAEILRIAGFDPYGYRGRHGQSIEAALAYYACFGKGAGLAKTVTAENSALCPNAPQYYGKIVDGADQNEAFGAYRFPNNRAIADIEADAKVASSSGPFSLDAILFGKWSD
jgi:hypothetical protein